MTIAEFNALPLEARRFIESNAGCLSCGNKEKKLTKAYELYLNNKKMAAYQMRGGGVNYVEENGNAGILYNIKADDEPQAIREKIRLARAIHKKYPEKFLAFNDSELTEVLKKLPKAEVADLREKKDAKKEQPKKEELQAEDEKDQENPEAETEEGDL